MEEISYRNYIILDPHDIYKKNNDRWFIPIIISRVSTIQGVAARNCPPMASRLFAWSFSQFKLRPSEQHLVVPSLPGLLTRAWDFNHGLKGGSNMWQEYRILRGVRGIVLG